MNARELRAKIEELLKKAGALNDTAEKENRDFSPEEQADYNKIMDEVKSLKNRLERAESMPAQPPTKGPGGPYLPKIPLGDNEDRAFAHFFRTGDEGGIRSLRSAETDEETREQRAYEVHVPTGMEMRTTADVLAVADATGGGPAVPTGFVQRIAARRNEIRLAERLGIQNIPGVGTTVNHAYENADPSVFASTSEQVDALTNTYEADRPTLATKAFTLAKKTKKLELTEEVLADEDANLMGFIADHIGRAIGLTHNSLLLTEVAANGSSLKTFASPTAIAAGEPEDLVYHDTLGFYLDDTGSIAWVTRPTTFGAIKSLTGNSRLYDAQAPGSQQRLLLEYPVLYSNYATAIAASAKSLYFGNWYYVGMRESPALSFIRDPYTTDGIVYLKYSFRTCYGVLIAGAVGYGKHPTG